MTAVETDVYD